MSSFLQPILMTFLVLWGLYAEAQQVKPSRPGAPQQQQITNQENDPMWQKVDSLSDIGLPQSALKLVGEIMQKSLNANDFPQYLKANLYELKLRASFEENYLQNFITEKDAILSKNAVVQQPVTQILHSIVAQLYWQYYTENRYVILDRTVIERETQISKDDLPPIETWDANIFITKVSEHYNSSLQNPDLLKSISLKQFDLIIEKGEGSKEYRPTLFDFLGHRAVDFFTNEEALLTKPINTFIIKDISYFSEANNFIALNIESPDKQSFHFQALKIFQQLMSFHLNDRSPSALVDADLKRLEFIHANINLPERDSLYLEALLKLEQKYKGDKVSADIMYAIASHYFAPPEPPVRILKSTIAQVEPDYIKAREWCLKTISSFPETKAAKNCKTMLRAIEEPFLEFTHFSEASPEQHFPMLLKFRNINKVWLRLIKTKYIPSNEYYSDRNESLRQFINAKSLKNWSIDLPDIGDYKHHSAELVMPEIENGNYVLIISDKPEVSLKDTTLTYGFYQISDLSYISRTAPNGAGLIYVLNRKDGKPIKGVEVQSFINNYDYKVRKYSRQLLNKYITGDDGSFSIEAPGNKQANLSFEFRYKDDTLIAENYYGLYDKTRYRERQDRITTFFFTDRAIYRPGQPVYFKGIVLNSKANEYSIIEGHKSVVSLYDVNGQKLSDIQVTSGKYGSFSGSFVLPASGLTGNMRIESESGSAYFMMEEYKRPRFEVTYKPIDTTYRLNELVNIKGEARTYSDVPLQDAIVKYRVVRSAIYPFFRSFFHIWPPFRIPDAEIAAGTTKVSSDGTFDIQFIASPDPNDYGDQDPLYNFLVYADVTDINGETHSGETSIMVSRKALLLETDIPKEINANDWKFIVKATNLSGEKVGTVVKIVIHRLKAGSLITPRKWDIPDTALYSREDFKNLLPYFPYMDEEAIPAGYEGKGTGINSLKEQRIFEGSINTNKDSIVSLTNLKPEPGSYLVTLSAKDPYGNPVSLEQQLIVFNPESKKIPAPEHLWFLPLHSELHQGEKVRLLVGSSIKGHVLIELENAENIIMHKWFGVSGQRFLEFEIPSGISGQVKLIATMVYDNYNHTETYDFNIKDVSRELKFDFETFRSPLLPGGTEKWKIKITGSDDKPLDAEFLASMYDASLNAFAPHSWNFTLSKSWPLSYSWEFNQAFNINGSLQGNQNYYPDSYFEQEYDKLNWFGYNLHEFRNGGVRFAKAGRIQNESIDLEMVAEDREVTTDAVATQEMSANAPSISPIQDSITRKPQVRKNLQETAFFYPHLTTNEKGEVWVEFIVPEALTRWNFMGLAHSPELRYGQFNKEVITRKELMVTPNLPRFFRDGDKMVIQAKINNLTTNPIQGKAQLELLDALTMQQVNQAFGNNNNSNSFEMKENGNVTVAWNIIIPSDVQAVIVRITAEAGNHSDGEEVILPILTNRMMVTETKPLPINGNQTRNYVFNPLVSGKSSSTLVPHRLTLEFTSNPAWYAIQALPWLESRENENSDQIFNRFYANSIASHIANSSPKIRNVFEIWKNRQPEALLSQLEKNQELKSLVISETPWLVEAKNESEQKQRIAVMFDLNRLANEKFSSMQRLEQKQTVNGAWPWFEGMPESRYITQLIVTGLGKLSYMKVIDFKTDNRTHDMTMRAYNWLAQRMAEDYQRILKDSSNANNSNRPTNKPDKKDPNKEDHLSYENIQFLYSMSYLQAEEMQQPSSAFSDALAFYGSQARKYWTVKSLYAQAMIGLWAGRSGDMKTAQSIIASLRERYTAIEEMGIYWTDNISGYFWYQAPVETQAILIELFEEYGNNRDEVDKMKTWLLKQKQTQSWPSTTATADAVYALILRGTDLLQVNSAVKITLGKEIIDVQNSGDIQTEAGTGYFKTSWGKKEITSDMSNITVTKSSDGPGWGALYFQYFEDLDKIKSSAGPLKITKQLFIRENTQSGQRLIPITENNPIQIGDQVIVRIEITSDRILEYVHLKDMRASAFEPVTTISGYQWNSGLGYYQSTKDASTDFFISYLPKGIHVFEYRLVASQSGTYSNGITSIQCMYAPEFASHSEGMKVSIK